MSDDADAQRATACLDAHNGRIIKKVLVRPARCWQCRTPEGEGHALLCWVGIDEQVVAQMLIEALVLGRRSVDQSRDGGYRDVYDDIDDNNGNRRKWRTR